MKQLIENKLKFSYLGPNEEIMMLQTDQHRPDRQPKPGDPLRDPHQQPSKVNPSRQDVNKQPEKVKENQTKELEDKDPVGHRPH